MKKKTIAIDMDGVLADIETHLIHYYEKVYGIKILKENIQGLTEIEAFQGRDFLYHIVNTKGFFRTLPVMKEAVESVRKLNENYEVYIVSAAMEFPLSLSEKLEWLGEHFPFIEWKNIIFCGDKSRINTDFMIDDHCKNLDFFMGKAIMFSAFHNSNENHHLRVNNWNEAVKTIYESV